MAETKDKSIMVNLEPTFYAIMQVMLDKENMAASAYCRSLVIKDLINRGLVTESILTEVILGEKA